jgi:hypothetical protein
MFMIIWVRSFTHEGISLLIEFNVDRVYLNQLGYVLWCCGKSDKLHFQREFHECREKVWIGVDVELDGVLSNE